MWQYSDKVFEYFRNPKNLGEIENPDGRGEVGSDACGDLMQLTIKVDPETKVITDAKFKTFGCASAIASASVLTELIIGKTIDEARKVTNDDIVKVLGGLPNAKVHCSVMGKEALDAAINDYLGIETKKSEHEDGKVICNCFGITDKTIEKAIREHDITTVDEVTKYTKAGGACQSCHLDIQELIDKVRAEMKK